MSPNGDERHDGGIVILLLSFPVLCIFHSRQPWLGQASHVPYTTSLLTRNVARHRNSKPSSGNQRANIANIAAAAAVPAHPAAADDHLHPQDAIQYITELVDDQSPPG